MTRDELLAALEPEKTYIDAHIVAALRGVVERHTDFNPGGKGGLRPRCRECGFAYPCPTIEGISKEMS